MLGLSIVTTFHNEDVIAQQTILSIARSARFAIARGRSVEWIVIMDNAGSRTKSIVKTGLEASGVSFRIEETIHGDLAMARNSGVARAGSELVAITDGDDFYSENWFDQAASIIDPEKHEIVVSPELVIEFGSKTGFFQQVGSDSNLIDKDSMLVVNPWVSCVVANKSIFERIPYLSKKGGSYLFEDWQWNCEILASGLKRGIAPRTSVFYRRKIEGMLSTEKVSRSTFGRTRLFDRGAAR